MRDFDFNQLFIYDMANNHQGDLKHGLNIIKEIGTVSNAAGVRAALKFQFRQLDTFIHPDFKDRDDIKHIPRFMSTNLKTKDYAKMTQAVKNAGLITMSTPFDEDSVDLILDLNIDIIKIASCSASDRPLLEKVVDTNRPVVISTAGLSMSKIDRLVSFLEHKRVHFALMHCVALYPTPTNKLHLNQIESLRNRFPHIPIGFSTHEDPDNLDAIKIAYAKGASLFERHVGINNDKYQLNKYSATPKQIAKWLKAYYEAVDACGGNEQIPASIEERASLNSLQRGVYTKKNIKKGNVIKRNDVFFAMPYQKEQLTSGSWHKAMIADKTYQANEPLNISLANLEIPKEELVYQIMLQIKGMLNNARIFIGEDSSIEISHHYGLERFREFGAVIIDCMNREYCKKIIIQLPRQKHPYHYHQKKEETFQLLYGDLEVVCEGKKTKLNPGDTFLVEKSKWHKFHTLDGAIFEEVSTTHYNDDSFYEDERIALLPRNARKTTIPNWENIVSDTL